MWYSGTSWPSARLCSRMPSRTIAHLYGSISRNAAVFSNGKSFSTYFLFLLCFLVPSAASDTLRSPQIWREMQYGKACRVLVFAQPAHRQRENVLFLRCLSFPLRVLICWRSDRAYKTAPGPIRRISRWCQPFLDPGATHESPRTDHRERTKSRPVLQHITRISRDGLSAAHP